MSWKHSFDMCSEILLDEIRNMMNSGLSPNLEDGIQFRVMGCVKIDGKNGKMVFILKTMNQTIKSSVDDISCA